MANGLQAKVTRKTKNTIRIEISRESFEAFCNATGLYREGFIEALDASERDHRTGRITKRKTLHELIK